jgi:hypothetical protein
MSPFMKVRKSSRILLVCGSSGVKPNTCFTITLNVNCMWNQKKESREKINVILLLLSGFVVPSS